MSTEETLDAEAQAGEVRQLLADDSDLTLDALAVQRPDLAEGIAQVRQEEPAKSGSGAEDMRRVPLADL